VPTSNIPQPQAQAWAALGISTVAANAEAAADLAIKVFMTILVNFFEIESRPQTRLMRDAAGKVELKGLPATHKRAAISRNRKSLTSEASGRGKGRGLGQQRAVGGKFAEEKEMGG
jgi:hypothetical protein